MAEAIEGVVFLACCFGHPVQGLKKVPDVRAPEMDDGGIEGTQPHRDLDRCAWRLCTITLRWRDGSILDESHCEAG